MGEKEGFLPFPRDFEMICVHHSTKVDTQSPCKGIVPPLVLSNFHEPKGSCEPSSLSRYVPARLGNSTRFALEKVVAFLNRAKHCLCFASGIGAIGAILALLKTGDHVIISDDVYGGTTESIMRLNKFCIQCSHVDFHHMENVENAITPETKLIWTENPTNPKLKVIDMCRTVEIGRKHCLWTVVDNSILTPYLQRPLDFGIDLVVHSLSKYMNGHSDVIMGAVCTNRDDLYENLKYIQTHIGHVPSPFDCSQILRSLKTLPCRLRRHQQSSLKVAKYLMNHPKIEEVIHPGLPTHSHHELFKSQTSGHSGVISFYLKGGLDETMKFLDNLTLVTQALSMGGYESLIEIPILCSHSTVPKYLQEILKLNTNFLRMSVGLEDVDDIIKDLDQALEKVP